MGLLIRFLLISLVFSRLPSHGLSLDLESLGLDKLLFDVKLFGINLECAYDHFPFVIINNTLNIFVADTDNGAVQWVRESANAKFQQRILVFLRGKATPINVGQLISGVVEIYKSANDELLNLVETYPEVYSPLVKGKGELNYQEFAKKFLSGLQEDCSVPTTPRTPLEIYTCVMDNWEPRIEKFVFLDTFLKLAVKSDEQFNEIRTAVLNEIESVRRFLLNMLAYNVYSNYYQIAVAGSEFIKNGAVKLNDFLKSYPEAFDENVKPLPDTDNYYRKRITRQLVNECGALGTIDF